jgi:hypothetical protein
MSGWGVADAGRSRGYDPSMPPSPAPFHDWHDFFLLLGTASATLVGLMFVATSIGASIFKEENRPALEIFLGPTVVHFSSILVLCLLALLPQHWWMSLAALAGLIGVGGFVYSAVVLARLLRRMRSGPAVELVDRIFYAWLPALAYLIVLGAAALLYRQSEWGMDAVVAGMIALLVAAIRNAWDMMLWIALRVPAEPRKEGS